ncbi:MAG: helix-turn-helix domain-containing protein, partial [Myxococcales bacterium]
LRGLAMDDIEREAIRLSLRRHHGKRSAVVKELGLAKSTVMKRIAQWGLQDEGREPGAADLADEESLKTCRSMRGAPKRSGGARSP